MYQSNGRTKRSLAEAAITITFADRRRAYVAIVLCIVSALLGASLVYPAPVGAATYEMRTCNVPGHPTAPVREWTKTYGLNLATFNNCATGGGFGFSLPGVRSIGYQSGAYLRLVRPSNGALRAIELRRARLWVIARLAGAGSPMHVVAITMKDGGTESGTVVARPPGSNTVPIAYDSETLPDGTSLIDFSLTCGAANYVVGGDANGPQDCNPSDHFPLEVLGSELVLSETVPPTASLDAGTLLGAEHVSGVRTLSYAASDYESGLSRIEAVIDDAVVATRDLGAACEYADFTPCPTRDEYSFAIDTGKVADGRHSLSLRIVDAAGNRRVLQASGIDIRNIAPDSPRDIGSGGPLDGDAFLAVSFAGTSRTTVTLPFGRRATIRGRLSTESQRGVRNVRIDVLERLGRVGAREVPVGSAQTRTDGTFLYALAGNRPNRTIRLAYRMGSTGRTVSRLLRLKVRAASSLRVSLRGTLLRFSGRVLSRPVPRYGKRVMLQGRAPGFLWAQFAAIRTDRRGGFSGSYRLPVRRPGVRLQIRVVVPAERGYAYLMYRGHPTALRVR